MFSSIRVIATCTIVWCCSFISLFVTSLLLTLPCFIVNNPSPFSIFIVTVLYSNNVIFILSIYFIYFIVMYVVVITSSIVMISVIIVNVLLSDAVGRGVCIIMMTFVVVVGIIRWGYCLVDLVYYYCYWCYNCCCVTLGWVEVTDLIMRMMAFPLLTNHPIILTHYAYPYSIYSHLHYYTPYSHYSSSFSFIFATSISSHSPLTFSPTLPSTFLLYPFLSSLSPLINFYISHELSSIIMLSSSYYNLSLMWTSTLALTINCYYSYFILLNYRC